MLVSMYQKGSVASRIPEIMLQQSISEPSVEQPEPKQAASTAGYVAVKPEFLLPPAQPTPQAASESTVANGLTQPEQSKSRKRRPYLPERPAECRSYFADGVCSFGADCRLSHDTAAYLAAKPPDLGPACFVFETTGRCPSGLLCRFAGAHVDADGRNLTDPDKQRAWAAAGQEELHGLDRELQLALRNDEFDFRDAYAVLKKRGVQCKGRFAAAASRAEAKNETKTKALAHLSAPTAESSAPTAESSAPTAESSAPTAESSAQTAESSAPTAESSAPTAESSAPTAESSAPTAESSAQTAESSAPTAESSAPTAESSAPLGSSRNPLGSLAEVSRKRCLDFRNKLLLAPLTTVGNLPFRRVCVEFGADVTYGEMAMASNLLQGRNAEWALLRRHPSERCFGAQVCGSHPDQLARLAQLLRDRAPYLDFVDLNCGCPIDLVYQRGMGAGMLSQPKRLETSVACMAELLDCPLTVKVRTGVREGVNVAHELLPRLRTAGAAAVTIHGRSREQRYRRLADWNYIGRCAAAKQETKDVGTAEAEDDRDFFVIGNGDVYSPDDLQAALATGVDAVMVARGALVKPWVFTELREGRLWDISSSERMDLLRRYVNYGLMHWGSDAKGVETVRRFFLEWQSFLCRYVPVGLLERPPQRSNERPPAYFGRDDLETLMASQRSEDWVRLSAMLLGPPPPGFSFTPKHKASG